MLPEKLPQQSAQMLNLVWTWTVNRFTLYLIPPSHTELVLERSFFAPVLLFP